MSRHDTAGDALDARMRDVHARSLDHLSPRVQAQLGATPRRASRGLLPWAGMATAGLALALVVQLHPPSTVQPPAQVATVRPASEAPRLAALGSADSDCITPDQIEDPVFYLWRGDGGTARTE